MADDYGSDINGYLVASMAGPVKRKRGRPRKNPLPADDAAAKAEIVRAPDFRSIGTVRIDEGELAPDYKRPGLAIKRPTGHEGVEGPAAGPVVKRKRGRPRKIPLPEAGVSTGLAGVLALEPCVGTGVNGRAVVPVKRRFGRSRKEHLPGARSPAVSVMHLPDGMAGGRMTTEPAVVLVKRGPGRPRKSPLAMVEARITPAGGSLSGPAVAGHGPELAAGLASELIVGPVKRKPGRPRKQPLPEPDRPGRTALLPVSGAPAPGLGHDRAGIGLAKPDAGGIGLVRPDAAGIGRESPKGVGSGNKDGTGIGIGPVRPAGNGPGNPGGTGIGHVDRFGIGPSNKEGIGFWPPRPDEIESVKSAAAVAGLVRGLKRGRRKKTGVPTENAPGRLDERGSGPAGNGARAFCGKCGTYIRMFRPARGRWRKVCPKCHPEKMLDMERPRVNLDKTGLPCKDRGTCRPVRCLKAFDCEEMRRNR